MHFIILFWLNLTVVFIVMCRMLCIIFTFFYRGFEFEWKCEVIVILFRPVGGTLSLLDVVRRFDTDFSTFYCFISF